MQKNQSFKTQRTSHEQCAYFLLRLAMGINFLGHGLARIPEVSAFQDWMIGMFAHSVLPTFGIKIFAAILPFLEFFIGLFLIVGLFTRVVLIVGMLWMICLIFGSCLIAQWDFAGIQMLYVLLYYILLRNLTHNYLTVDHLIFNSGNRIRNDI